VSDEHGPHVARAAGVTGVTAGFVDLHAHSTASDGAQAPEGVVEAASRAGLAALALTDHDTLAGVGAAREAGERLGVRIVAGVELSVMDDERELHLLGLHIVRVELLESELAAVRQTRRTRAEGIVEKLNALGVPIVVDAVFAQAGDGAVGRPHVARALIAGGWVRDQREAFDRFLGAGRPANVEKQRISFTDGVRLIHACGGLAVLAHPGQDGRRERLESLVGQGLDGIEVLHPSHSAEDIARLAALAAFFSLVPSGGSDWHGTTAGSRVLGCMRVPAEWLDRQDVRLAARVPAGTATDA
jgi:predicted metal-dependent phosphoesterase TrpH